MKKLFLVVTGFIFSLVMISGFQTTTGRTAGEVVDDSVIVTDLNAKIVKDPELHVFKINVDSYNGNVSLTGKVRSKEAEDRLIALAKDTKSVKSVTSNLTIEGTRQGRWEGTSEGTTTEGSTSQGTTTESTGTTETTTGTRY